MSRWLRGLDSLGSRIPAASALALGRSFFGIATIASGVLQLVTGNFVRLVPKAPAWVPTYSIAPYLVGVVLIVTGLAILSRRMARPAAAVVAAMIVLILLWCVPPLSAAMILLWVLLLHIPRSLTGPGHADEAAGALEALALSGVALMVAGRAAAHR